MAKKIERSRIDAGRFELPSKLAFLSTEKVDFLSVTDRDGQWSVDVPAATLQKLAKARANLKAIKAEHTMQLSERSAGLEAERSAHQATREELGKLQRRTKALEKKLSVVNGEAGVKHVATNPDKEPATAERRTSQGSKASAKPSKAKA